MRIVVLTGAGISAESGVPTFRDADGLWEGHRVEDVATPEAFERDPDTGLFVGHVPGWPGAHSQGETIEELDANLQEVIGMLLEDGEPKFESEFVAVQTIRVA